MDHNQGSHFNLSLTVKQIFGAGLALGIVATLAAAYLWGAFGGASLVKGDRADKIVVNDGTGAPAPAPAGEQVVGEVAPVTDADHIRGDADAEITLIEYSDFECPFCARFHPTMQRVVDEYAGKVRWIYRHFPLSSIHPNAQKAAEASECAAEQGKFWEMADKMVAMQSSGLGIAQLKAYAKEVGVKDQKKFDSCLDSGKYADRVASDLQSGEAAGVQGTPGTFVLSPKGEPQMIPGALPYESVKAMIDVLL